MGELSRRFVADLCSFRRSDASLALYVASLAIGAAGISLALLFAGYDLSTPWGVVALAGVAALAERAGVRLNATTEASISLLPTVFAAVLFGPLAAMVVGAASMLGDSYRPYTRWLAYTSSRAITAAAAVSAASRQQRSRLP